MMVQHGRYSIRRFAQRDKTPFIKLHEQVFGLSSRGEEWFDWKFKTNPYVDHVPIYVSELDGKLVGACGFLPLPINANDERYLGLQPCDAMVHPDHRREGLFSRMTEKGAEDYSDGLGALLFCFPATKSKSNNGFLKMGWKEVDIPDYIRTPVNTSEDTRSSSQPDLCFEIQRYDTAPVRILDDIYSKIEKDKIHTIRDEEFYRWRISRAPGYDPAVYIGYIDDNPVLGGVVRTASRVYGVDDFLYNPQIDHKFISFIMSRIMEDASSYEYLRIFGNIFPKNIYEKYGFENISEMSSLVRPMDLGNDWELSGLSLLDPKNWRMSMIDTDHPQ